MENKDKKKKKKGKKKLIIILVIFILIIGSILVSVNKAKNAINDKEIPTENIEKRTIMKSISVTGTIKSSSTKEYTSTLVGKQVKDVNVQVGDEVKVGDTLVTFDVKDLKDNLDLAQNSLNIAKEQTNLSISAAEKGVNSANDSRNSQYNTLDSEIKNIENNINQIDASINSAQNALNVINAAESVEKANLVAVKSANQTVIDNYNNKNKEYTNALAAVNSYKVNSYNKAEEDYTKYFTKGSDGIFGSSVGRGQLDPVTGITIPLEEYKNGEYATVDHRNVDTNFNTVKDNLKNLENTASSIKLELDSLQNSYNIANDSITEAEGKYNSVVSQKTAAEKTLSELKLNKEQLNSSYQKAQDTANATKKSLDSTVENAKTSLESTKLTAQSTMLTQENQIKTVKEQIGKCTLLSDVSGKVTKVNVKAGDTYQGGTVVKIEGCETFIVEAQVDEYDVADIKVGMKVKIKTDATRNEELEGRVTFVAPTATEASATAMPMTTGTSSTGATYKVEIAIDSVNDRLRIGMTAKLSIITEEADDVLTIPYDAIEEKEDGRNVIRVLEDDNVTQTEIEITKGLESDYYTEIKSDKIKEGMKVVVPDSNGGDAMTTLINTMQDARGF